VPRSDTHSPSGGENCIVCGAVNGSVLAEIEPGEALQQSLKFPETAIPEYKNALGELKKSALEFGEEIKFTGEAEMELLAANKKFGAF
jgi:hypothetical protein